MTALGESPSLPPKLGRYELITRIGEGGMAEVQLALQRGPAGFEKLVVVKLVHQSLASQKPFVDMLLDEARVAALVKHPNVVDIYDLGEADGRYFIAMEYLEGEPLLAVLRAGRDGQRLDVLSTARLIADTAEGLDAAHELRSMAGDPIELVHHDISLGNIVVLYNGQVKLVDFGVAKATQSATARTKVQGKFGYMAPEKLRGGPGDRRSDIWSLGCVLWEALTLRRLFRGGNDGDTMQQVLDIPILAPSKVNGDVPADFDPIALRSLERDPSKRYPTAKAMAAEIEEVLRKHGYAAKNDMIAKYMQATFADHIAARKKLLQEVSSKGRPSQDVLEAAFNLGAMASGSPVHTSTDPWFKRPRSDDAPSERTASRSTEPPPLPRPHADGSMRLTLDAPGRPTPPPATTPPPRPPLATTPPPPPSPLSTTPSPQPAMLVAPPPPASTTTLPLPAKPSVSPPPPPPSASMTTAPLPAKPLVPPAPTSTTQPSPTPTATRAATPAATPTATPTAPDDGPTEIQRWSPPSPQGDGPTEVQRWSPLSPQSDGPTEVQRSTPLRRRWLVVGAAAACVLASVVASVLIATSGDDEIAGAKLFDSPSRAAPGAAVTSAAVPEPSRAAVDPPSQPAPTPEPEKPSPPVVASPRLEKPSPPVVASPRPENPSPPVVASPPDAMAPAGETGRGSASGPIADPPSPEPVARPPRPRHVQTARPAQNARATAERLNPDEMTKEALQAWVRGDSKTALALCKRVTQAIPSYAPAWRLMGLVYERLGEKTSAHNAFQKYLQSSPGAPDAAGIRARLEAL